MKRTERIAAMKSLLKKTRLGQDGFGLAVDEGIQFWIKQFDTIEVKTRDLYRRNRSSTYLGHDLSTRKQRIG